MTTVTQLARAAKDVAPVAARLSTSEKNTVLGAVAQALRDHAEMILQANEQDLAAGRQAQLSDALLDRLRLDTERIDAIAGGLEKVAGLPDPVGEIVDGRRMDNGIVMRQVRVPLGVVGVVYEARPNVTIDAVGLALKSGNVALLRGSRSAAASNAALVAVVHQVLTEHGLPTELVQLLPSDSHQSVEELITARGLVDVVIPRGGAGLINAVVTGATVPTIETGTGNNHFYIDASADLPRAIDMLLNGKTRRPSVCNATETVLLDAELPDSAKAQVIAALQGAGVSVHGDSAALEAVGAADIIPAQPEDWEEEWLSMDICAAIVPGVDGAIAHISRYSTGHTEGIAAQDADVLLRFANEVDAAAVSLNASTAFTDGEIYGMGAEIGVSTQKLHARGPFALPELTTTKWILQGTGQTRP